MIEVDRFGMSRGEFQSIKQAVGSLEALIDPKCKEATLLQYLAYDADKEEKLLEHPACFRTPIVRNAKQATVGYCPEVWKEWK